MIPAELQSADHLAATVCVCVCPAILVLLCCVQTTHGASSGALLFICCCIASYVAALLPLVFTYKESYVHRRSGGAKEV